MIVIIYTSILYSIYWRIGTSTASTERIEKRIESIKINSKERTRGSFEHKVHSQSGDIDDRKIYPYFYSISWGK